jgi:hypothetical protein
LTIRKSVAHCSRTLAHFSQVSVSPDSSSLSSHISYLLIVCSSALQSHSLSLCASCQLRANVSVCSAEFVTKTADLIVHLIMKSMRANDVDTRESKCRLFVQTFCLCSSSFECSLIVRSCIFSLPPTLSLSLYPSLNCQINEINLIVALQCRPFLACVSSAFLFPFIADFNLAQKLPFAFISILFRNDLRPFLLQMVLLLLFMALLLSNLWYFPFLSTLSVHLFFSFFLSLTRSTINSLHSLFFHVSTFRRPRLERRQRWNSSADQLKRP